MCDSITEREPKDEYKPMVLCWAWKPTVNLAYAYMRRAVGFRRWQCLDSSNTINYAYIHLNFRKNCLVLVCKRLLENALIEFFKINMKEGHIKVTKC